jgi:GeoRSP system PqqD family protein
MRRIYRNPDVLWREESQPVTGTTPPGEAVAAILFTDGQILSLNELGAEIWQLCNGLTEDEIVQRLMTDFAVTEQVVRSDLVEFLAELAKKGFVHYA